MGRHTLLTVCGMAIAATALFSAIYIHARAPAANPAALAATPAAAPGEALLAPAAPFDAALLSAANALFSRAALPAGNDKIDLVIDPLIDGISGAQSAASHLMEKRLTELAQKSYPRFRVQPFNTTALERSPVLLVGTLTAINNAGVADGAKDAYRICLALADLQSKTVISKGVAKALPEGVDATPTPAFADTPAWADDASTVAYIKTCHGTRPGDRLDPLYIERIGTASLISDGIVEYDNKRYREALAFYRTAMRMPGGNQLRVHNGIYLANYKLGRREDSAQTFGSLVSYGLKNNKLAVNFLFRPGSTQLFGDEDLTSPYSMWIQQIATWTVQTNNCLEIVGHTSPTGPALLNERLSVLRAQAIKTTLEQADKRLIGKLIANGVGPRENLIGTGKDDASDAADRRMEFKVLKC